MKSLRFCLLIFSIANAIPTLASATPALAQVSPVIPNVWETKDWVTAAGIIVSAILVVIGWIFSRHKDREQDKFKIRHSRRETLVQEYFQVQEIIRKTQGRIDSDPNFVTHWLKLAFLMNMYGTKEENAALEDFAIKFLGPNSTPQVANTAFNKLASSLKNSVRKDLGFSPI